MRYAALLTVFLLLTGCVPQQEDALRLHDVSLYNVSNDTNVNNTTSNTLYGYFYGAPTQTAGVTGGGTTGGSAASATSLTVGGRTLELTEGTHSAPLAVENALLVNGEPYLSQPLDAVQTPFEVSRVPFSTDVVVRTGEGLQALLYWDGNRWFTLLSDPQPGFDARVSPQDRPEGLRGAGQLTRQEAAAFEGFFSSRGPLVVGVLATPPTRPRSVGGLDEYLRTALVVQEGLETDTNITVTPVRELVWDVLASGNQASAGDTAQFEIATTQEAFVRLWNMAYGSQLTLPPIPPIDFRRESVLGFFLGTRSTGGYGVEVRDVTTEGGEYYVNVLVREPGPGTITTQAITSPWVLVRVPRPDISVAWFRSAETGELIGVARETK